MITATAPRSQEAPHASPEASPGASALQQSGKRRVLLLGDAVGLRTAYARALTQAGYETQGAAYATPAQGADNAAPSAAIARYQQFKPDLLIILCNDRRLLAPETAPSRSKTASWEAPVLLVTERWREADALLARDEIHDWITPGEPEILVQKSRSLLRVATFNLEFARRRAAAARMGLVLKERMGKPVIPGRRDIPIVYFGPPSIDHRTVAQLAQKNGRDFIASFSAETVFDYLSLHPLAVVVTDFSADPEATETFLKTLRADQALGRLPVTACVDPDDVAKATELLRFGLTDVVVKPVNPTFLRARIDTLTYQSVRLQNVSELYTQRGFQALRSKMSGLFMPAYGEAYLNQLIGNCRQRNQCASALLFAYRASPVVESEAQAFDPPNPTLHVAGLLKRLMRFEDFLVELSQDRLLAVLPNTGEKEAKTALWRVTSVLEKTDWQGPYGKGHLATAQTLIQANDQPGDILSRLAAGLDDAA